MAYLSIEDFKGGMDRRRSRYAGVPGTLWALKNAIITRGGEIENCKKFVSTYAVTGSKGLFSINNSLYVFGSADSATLSIPSGVTYQRLRAPDTTLTLTKILSVAPTDGKPYVVAKFSDNSVYHFYDGALVKDWYAGVVKSYMADNTGIAEHLATLFSGDADFTATTIANVLTITGNDESTWTYSTSTQNGGSVNDQTLSASLSQSAIVTKAETLARGSFNITGGLPATAATGNVTLTGGGAGSVDTVTVNGVNILGSVVPFNTSLNQTAADVAATINSYSSAPDYTAAAVGASITITAGQERGAADNGFAVATTTTTITTSTAAMAGGVDRGISSIKVDGIEVLGTTVNLVGSYSEFAARVASQITTYTSSPNYTGEANVQTVTTVGATGSGATPNSKVGVVTLVGGVTVSSTSFTMAGGIASVAGQPQKVAFTVGGTFEAGDKFNIRLTKGTRDAYFGYSGAPTPSDSSVLLPFKTKMHAAGGSLINFSSVTRPTLWNRNLIQDTVAGAGFINISTQDGGGQTITGLGIYNGLLAAFSEENIQIWSIFADPANNSIQQNVNGTGTKSRKSVRSFGNSDTFYLDHNSGIRSLKIRDYVNAPYSDDVGTAIDTFVQEHMDTLSDDTIADAPSAIEPRNKQYWQALGDRIYIYSLYPRSKVSAWSYIEPGFTVEDFAVVGKKLYVRSGDTIYLYGGADGTTYPGLDELVTEVELPFHAMGKPSTKKTIRGLDMGVTNEWECKVRFDLVRENARHSVATISNPTYNGPYIPIELKASHVALSLRSAAAGKRSIANLAIVFTETKDQE